MQPGHIMVRYGVAVLVTTMLHCSVTGSAAAQELRPVLSTGDAIPGLAQIGRDGLDLVLLDDAGRALVSRVGAEREETYWADGEHFTPLLDPAAAGDLELVAHTLFGDPAGAVAGFGFHRSEAVAWDDALYAVKSGRAIPIVRVGDHDPDGYRFCELDPPVLNAHGAVAFGALVIPPDGTCPTDDPAGDGHLVYRGLYVADGERLQRVGGTGPLAPAGWDEPTFELLALGNSGEAIVLVTHRGNTQPAERVLAAGPGGVRELYRVGDADGPGVIGRGSGPYTFRIVAANGTGQLLVRRIEGAFAALYRVSGDDRMLLFREYMEVPWSAGTTYAARHVYTRPSGFNHRGDVLMVFDQGDPPVLYPADGTPRVFPGRASDGALNDAGEVALTHRTSDASLEVVRYRGTEVRRLAGTGDRLPGGGALAAHGLGQGCIAPNGAVAAPVYTIDGDMALACGDASGFAAVSRRGDGRPDGRRFYTFDGCAFGRSDELFFGGTGLAPSGTPRLYVEQRALYRAHGDVLERVLGRGDVLDDGSLVSAVDSDAGSFDADGTGRLLAHVEVHRGGRALVIAHPDGVLERLPLRVQGERPRVDTIGFSPESSVDHEYLAGLTDSPAAPAAPAAVVAALDDAPSEIESVWMMSARLSASGAFVLGRGGDSRGPVVLVHVDRDGVRELPMGDYEPVLFVPMHARGDRVILRAHADGRMAVLMHGLGEAGPRVIAQTGDPSPAGILTFPSPLALSSSGTVYFEDRPFGAAQTLVFAWEDGTLRVVGRRPAEDGWGSDTSEPGALFIPTRSRLYLTGAGASEATCPHPVDIVPPPLVPVPPPPGAMPPPEELPFEPASCAPGTACVYVSSVATTPGGTARVDVYLRTLDDAIAGTENEISVPGVAEITHCERNVAIFKESTLFAITGDRVRALVLSFVSVDPLPDEALLYSCEIAVSSDAPPGHYPLTCANPGASDPGGILVPITCADGVLTVTALDSATSAQAATTASHGGCAVQPGTREPGWVALLGLVVLVAMRRPRGRRAAAQREDRRHA